MFFGKKFSGYHKKSLSGLDILVLSIITNKNGITGYELIQDINDKFKDLWQASAGTIYPLLNRLSSKLLVETEELTDENNRKKKIYRISRKGKDELKRVLVNNLEPSITTLGDFIKTLFKASMPSEDMMFRMIGHFPFPEYQEIDKSEFTYRNIENIKRVISQLEHGRQRLELRSDMLSKKIEEYQEIVDKFEADIKNKKNIEISENEKDFYT